MDLSLFTLRVTHLKEVEPLSDSQAAKIENNHVYSFKTVSSRKVRLLDMFDNVYYATVNIFENGHGIAELFDPQLERHRHQFIPKVQKFLDQGFLCSTHPPLCRECWQEVMPANVGTIINDFRVELQSQPKLPDVLDREAEIPDEFKKLFEKSLDDWMTTDFVEDKLNKENLN